MIILDFPDYLESFFNNIHSTNGVGLHTDIYSMNRIGLHVENSPPTSSIRMKHSNVEKGRCSFFYLFDINGRNGRKKSLKV